MSPKLSRHVSADRLADNASRVFEMRQTLTSAEQAQVVAIKGLMLLMPLTHATQADASKIMDRGLLPYKDAVAAGMIAKDQGNTYEIDASLGLDEYTFMRFGHYMRGGQYGNKVVSIDPSILLEPGTIMTPSDINGTMRGALHAPYDSLSAHVKKEIDKKYFDKMVTGQDWVEILARRVMRLVSKINYELYPLMGEHNEIKHFGPIPPSRIHDVIDMNNKSQTDTKWREVVKSGFMPYALSQRLKDSQSPRDIHESVERARDAWKALLNEKAPEADMPTQP